MPILLAKGRYSEGLAVSPIHGQNGAIAAEWLRADGVPGGAVDRRRAEFIGTIRCEDIETVLGITRDHNVTSYSHLLSSRPFSDDAFRH